MILNILILRSVAMQMVLTSECKSCEISNQMFFNALFSFSKKKKMNWLWHYYCKLKLLSGAILLGASKEPEASVESSKTSAFLQK